MKRERAMQIAIPGNCPCCELNCFQTTIAATVKTPPKMDIKWWCHYCNTFFNWSPEERKPYNIESHFKRGLRGNVDYNNVFINPKLPDKFDQPNYDHTKSFQEHLEG